MSMRRIRAQHRSPASGGESDELGLIEAAAMRLLARREHSADELKRKLLAKGFDRELADSVLEKLTARRLLSDERFASSLVRHRVNRGQGPVRIRAELRQQGIDAGRIDAELRGAELDWPALAAQVRRRKFGKGAPRTRNERAKQARFLQYRGFSADQIRAAFGGSDELPAIGDEPTGDWPD
jgi:regulatory protein